MVATKEQFEREFFCPKCHGRGALVQEVVLGRGRMAAVIPLPPSRYMAVCCGLCGYTELYNTAIAEKASEPESDAAPASAALPNPE